MNSTVYYSETSSRVISPTETLEQAKEKGLIGNGSIIPKVLRVDGVDVLNIPVYFSFSRQKHSKDIDYRFTYAGKGITKEEAKCSAIFEGLERYAAQMTGREQLLIGTEDEIKNSVSLESFVVGSNIETHELVLEWTEVIDLSDGTKKFVPANYVYFPYRPNNSKIRTILPHDTNGLASGNTIEEALIHAIYEVVEKDAFCIFWNNSQIYQNVNISEINNDNVNRILSILDENCIKYVIKDITTNIGIPTYAAFLDCRFLGQPAFVYGSGAHLDPQIAILRAITEAIQLRASQLVLLRYKPEIRFKKIDGLGHDSHDIIENMTSPNSWNLVEPIFMVDNGITSIFRHQVHDISTLEKAINVAMKKIENVGYKVLYKQISQSDCPFPVVRVLIPGLQPSNGLPSRRSERLNTIPSIIKAQYIKA